MSEKEDQPDKDKGADKNDRVSGDVPEQLARGGRLLRRLLIGIALLLVFVVATPFVYLHN